MRVYSLGLLLLLASCDVGNDSLYTGSISEKNIGNLARLEVGMSKSTVLRIMHKPYNTECFMVGNDNFELWYYVTTVTGLGQTRMVPMNVTPLAMKNGTLVGWGYEYYRWLTREQYLEKKPTPKQPADEDKPLEKTLQTAPPLKVLTMSKAPDKSKEPPPKEKDKEKKPLLSPEDEERLEEESEQNFNFW